MPDEYWLILKGPRFNWINWPKRTSYFNKYCDWDTIHEFAQQLQEDHPEWKINIGVTRGEDIYVLA